MYMHTTTQCVIVECVSFSLQTKIQKNLVIGVTFGDFFKHGVSVFDSCVHENNLVRGFKYLFQLLLFNFQLSCFTFQVSKKQQLSIDLINNQSAH